MFKSVLLHVLLKQLSSIHPPRLTESSCPESVNLMKIDESNAELDFVTQPASIKNPVLRTIRGIDVQMSRKVFVETIYKNIPGTR